MFQAAPECFYFFSGLGLGTYVPAGYEGPQAPLLSTSNLSGLILAPELFRIQRELAINGNAPSVGI